MNFLVWLAIITFLILLPPVLLIVLMLCIATKFKFRFKVAGIVKYRDISLEYENEFFSLVLRLDLIHFHFIWLKLRVLLKGVSLNINFKSKIIKAKITITEYLCK